MTTLQPSRPRPAGKHPLAVEADPAVIVMGNVGWMLKSADDEFRLPVVGITWLLPRPLMPYTAGYRPKPWHAPFEPSAVSVAILTLLAGAQMPG